MDNSLYWISLIVGLLFIITVFSSIAIALNIGWFFSIMGGIFCGFYSYILNSVKDNKGE